MPISIIKRFEEVYGLDAIHSHSDLSFDRVKAERTERNKNGQAHTINERRHETGSAKRPGEKQQTETQNAHAERTRRK